MRKHNSKIIDIIATAANLGNKCSDLLSVHALSECDTVSKDSRIQMIQRTFIRQQKHVHKHFF